MECACACCGGDFEKKGRGFKRTGIHTKFRGGSSAAESLDVCYSIDVTPNKSIFICPECSFTIRSIEIKKSQLNEAEEKFRKIRNPGSYVAGKIPITPTHRRTPKRRKSISSKVHSHIRTLTPKKSSQRPVSINVANTELGRAVLLINQHRYRNGLGKLIKNSKSAKRSAMRLFNEIVRKEMCQFSHSCRKTKDTLSAIAHFDWDTLLQHARNLCPVMLEFITAALTRKQSHTTATKGHGKKTISLIPIIGLVLHVIGFTRNRLCNQLQQMISIMLWLGGCKRKVFGNLNKLALCQNVETTRQQVDNVRLDFDNTVKEWRDTLTNKKTGIRDETFDKLPELEDIWEDDVTAIESDAETNSESTQSAESESHATTDTSQSRDENAENTDDDISESDAAEATTASSLSGSESILETDSPHENLYYDITFDNVNQKIGVRHHTRGKKNTMLNIVQSYATMERTYSFGLSDEIPQAQAIREIPLTSLLPSDDDQLALKEELSVIISRILKSHIPAFADIKSLSSIPHQYSKESTHKSEIVPLGIINKDETKVSEMIEILESLSQYVPKDENGHPLTLTLFCDGLSCERVAGAERARINGEDRWSRLDMFEPGIQEWHKRLMYIQDTYDELFKFESHREKGTLFNIKQMFDHTGVSKNIMQCFDKAEELLDFATECYIVLAAMEFTGLDQIDGIPNEFPEAISDRQDFFRKIVIKILDCCFERPNIDSVLNVNVDASVTETEYCVCKLDIGGTMVYCNNAACRRGTWFHIDCVGITEDEIPEGDWFCCQECKVQKLSMDKGRKQKTVNQLQDGKSEYSKRLLWRGLNNIARHDAVKKNNGPRMVRHWKCDMIDFHERSHPKYFIFGHRLLSNVAGATSARVRHGLIWERTVNVNGGKRRNVPKDLHCEHLNREYKESSRVSSGQLTSETINRHSQMLGIGKVISKAFEQKVVSKNTHIRQHGYTDRSNDLKKMVKLLHRDRLFHAQTGRSFKGFEDFSRVIGVRKPRKLKEKLIKHLNTMATLRELNDIN